MTRKPYFRQFDGWWYAQIRVHGKRKQIKLIKGKENEQEAYRLFCEQMAKDPESFAEPTHLRVVNICDNFLDWCSHNAEPGTYEFYRHLLQKFCDAHGTLLATSLKPYHVTRYVDAQTYKTGGEVKSWGPTMKGHAIGALKRAYAFAVEQGLLHQDPIKHIKKPRPQRRERLVSAEERKEILAAASDQEFKLFLLAMQGTGARPGEIRTLRKENVDLAAGLWVFRKHKTGKRTGKPRVIYLTPPMLDLTKELLEKHGDDCLFRNSRGKPWTRNAIRIRFRNLRKKLPNLNGVVAYSYRHSFTTDGLEQGVPIATMAELLGHQTTRMIESNYGHLAERREHLRQAAVKTTEQKEGGCASGA